MKDFRYGFETRLPHVSYADAVERVTAALKTEGFGVLTAIDVRKTLKEKLSTDFRPYTILGACNPTLAKRALDAEPQIGLLLPCSVVVQEVPDGTSVSIADPNVMFTLVDNVAVAPVAREATERLRRVIESVEGGSA